MLLVEIKSSLNMLTDGHGRFLIGCNNRNNVGALTSGSCDEPDDPDAWGMNVRFPDARSIE